LTDFHRILATLGLVLILGACSSGEAQLEAELLSTESRLSELEAGLKMGSLRNATIIKQYSRLLKQSKPELSPLLTELEKEGTLANPVYKSLQNRLEAVRNNTEGFDSWVEKVEELQLLQAAANVSAFNDSLSDTVNVMADLSEGKLARVNAVPKETESKMNGSKDFGAGSQYVGNPHYGSWSHGSGGSLWAWYGQYHFFNSMFGGRRHYYNDWAGSRSYSYYSDIGRNTYTSRTQRASQQDVQQRAKKQFGSKGNFKSPYAKARSGATGMSRQSTAQQKSAFKSPYAKSGSSTSKYQSSTRNSGHRTSRGTSRGK
jgi:hypothetical protein